MTRTRRLAAHELARRTDAASTALAEAWLFPEGLTLAARTIASLVPGCAGMIYFRERDGRFAEIGHDTPGRLVGDWGSWPLPDTLDRMRPFVSYPLQGPDPFAGRFVSTAEHYGEQHDARDAYLTHVLSPNGFADHARVVLRRRGAMRAWCGIFRPLEDPGLTTSELTRLAGILPALQDAVRAADLTRYGRADAATIQTILAAFDRPVWLVTRRGTLAFANPAARGLGREVARVARGAAARAAHDDFAVSNVSIGGDTLALVIGRHLAGQPALQLPTSLARIADGIVAGLTDKQIAERLDVPLATVRTYVRRIYTRLGVHNRVELARCWRG